MPETGNKDYSRASRRLVVRIGKSHLSFSAHDINDPRKVIYEPYKWNRSLSPEANFRDACEIIALLRCDFEGADIMIDSPVLTVPGREFVNEDAETLYRFTFNSNEHDALVCDFIPFLNCHAVLAIDKSLKESLDKRLEDVAYHPVSLPVWKCLHPQSHTLRNNKLFAYLHDDRIEVFAFAQNHFKFHNQFPANNLQDAEFYVLSVWQQMGLKSDVDEFHLLGSLPDMDEYITHLSRFIKKVSHHKSEDLIKIQLLADTSTMTLDLIVLHNSTIS